MALCVNSYVGVAGVEVGRMSFGDSFLIVIRTIGRCFGAAGWMTIGERIGGRLGLAGCDVQLGLRAIGSESSSSLFEF